MTAAEPHVSLAIETDQRMNDAIIDGNQTPHPQLLMSSMIPVRREGAFDTYDATTMAAFSQTNKGL